MLEVSLKTNADDVAKYLKKVEDKMGNFQTPLKLSGLVMLKSVDQNFRDGGRPQKWAPLKPGTIKKKGSSAILQDKGYLKGGINMKLSGKDQVQIAPSTGTKKYAAVHQFGFPKKNIPARPYILFQEEDKRIIEKTFEKHIDSVLNSKVVFV